MTAVAVNSFEIEAIRESVAGEAALMPVTCRPRGIPSAATPGWQTELCREMFEERKQIGMDQEAHLKGSGCLSGRSTGLGHFAKWASKPTAPRR